MSTPFEQTNKKTGYMIIFNQQEFNDPRDFRIGSDKDVIALETTFTKYGVNVIEKPNLKLNEIKEEINTLSKRDFTGCKLVMCVLLTHGTENGIVTAKDQKFHHRETIINPIIKNKSLNGIVKIFIIVACRGPNRCFETDLIFEDGCVLSKEDGIDPSNILICYSTFEGHVSLRRKSGSYYIQNLCKLINENGSNVEIHSLLLDVNKCLREEKKQVTTFESSMDKFYLRDLLTFDKQTNNMPTSSKKTKTIVMCGETGVGKSTLGNLIVNTLNPKHSTPFEVMHTSASCPMVDNIVATVEMPDYNVNVIDTPGFGDTEGEELNALNVCHIWKALESDNVCAVLFLFKTRFTEITKIWYERLLNTIPEQHHMNIFVVNNQYGGDDISKANDIEQIRRLSKNINVKVSHVMNYPRPEDHKHLFKEWTLLPPFTAKHLKPPEVVYEREEFGPIKEKFHRRITVVEPRQESYEEIRREVIGTPWRSWYGHITGHRDVEYGDVIHTLHRTVQKDIEKDEYVKYRKIYRVRYDETRDFVGEEIIGDPYIKSDADSDNV